MRYSFFSRIRDILLLCSLFFLVKIAFERSTSFINDHKNSIIHELDRTFIDEIYMTQHQLHILQEQYSNNDEIIPALTDIKNHLDAIEEKYKTNSPGIMLLGPIGSAAIILKEEKLQKKLLIVVNDINKILCTLSKTETIHVPLQTIDEGISNNKKLLQTLIT